MENWSPLDFTSISSQFADEIQSRVEEYPHHINEMPVDCSSLNDPVLFFCVQTFASVIQHDEQENNTRENMESVHTCHHEEDRTVGAIAHREGRIAPFHAYYTD